MNREQLVQWVFHNGSDLEHITFDIGVLREWSIYANCCGRGNKKIGYRHVDLLTLVVL